MRILVNDTLVIPKRIFDTLPTLVQKELEQFCAS
jgi:hypothetical protein